MKQYHIYVFTQDNCPPCHRLKKHIDRLTDAEKSELDFVPLKTDTGARTSLAEELSNGAYADTGGLSRDGSVRLRPRHGIRVLRS